MKIGVAGIGRMGAAVAGRLISVGREVVVWNRTTGKTRELAERGAQVADTPAHLVAEADVILTMLTGDEAIISVYHGPQGLLSGVVRGKLFIEMSTVRPGVEQALASEVSAQGGSLVDCPVGGTVGPAREGRLFGFVGGSDEDVARAMPVLDQMCRRVEHVGPVGAGARLKLAINLPLMVYWLVLGEALALCAPLGLDPDRLINIFSDTSGGPNVLKARGAMVAAALRGQDTGPVTLDVDLVRKDLGVMLEEAAALNMDLPVARRALDCADDAAKEGLGASDAVVLTARLAKRGRLGSSREA